VYIQLYHLNNLSRELANYKKSYRVTIYAYLIFTYVYHPTFHDTCLFRLSSSPFIFYPPSFFLALYSSIPLPFPSLCFLIAHIITYLTVATNACCYCNFSCASSNVHTERDQGPMDASGRGSATCGRSQA